ncbi:MAG: helix-turn-helix domain-containing protein [Gemmatimonadetes bacterium]|nr:helix-turn-helix transcriptional regulator [Gemmatimonadota bacterium]NIR80314.1 helix-turn-helix transcriptional regulator [Gemmatimonadota bacterium]NIT89077.1 helix-turn-helix transcriptional regulator [Gemmatimonadota bacterium]NIU32874.1 helix-turn-helix transcriptional regulator [Gemmatimonadota bacterium]NIU37280.1 helix-turn-helix domain-containing protein [Gemmatimonadota bacterium]
MDPESRSLDAGPRSVTFQCALSRAGVVEVRYPPRTEFDTHAHDAAYLCLVTDGEYQDWPTGTGRRSVTTGVSLVYGAGSRHAVRTGTRGARVLHLTDPSGRGWADPLDPLAIGVLWQIGAAIRGLAGIRRDDADRLHLESLVLELGGGAPTGDTSSAGTREPPRAKGDWLRLARARLREGYREPISLGELAAHVGRHPTHLSRAFRERWGMTPGEYLRRIRVAAAVRALREKDEPLSRVALRAGFADQSHMGRWVRRYVGSTPGALRGGRARPRAAS